MVFKPNSDQRGKLSGPPFPSVPAVGHPLTPNQSHAGSSIWNFEPRCVKYKSTFLDAKADPENS